MVKVIDENGVYGWGEVIFEGYDFVVEGCFDGMIFRFIGLEVK